MHNSYTLTFSNSLKDEGSQLSRHHLSTCPRKCILSMTISVDAIRLAVSVALFLVACEAYFRRWQPSSYTIKSVLCVRYACLETGIPINSCILSQSYQHPSFLLSLCAESCGELHKPGTSTLTQKAQPTK